MNRRSFTQLLTLGAGWLGLWQASGEADDEGAGLVAGGEFHPPGNHPQPVNVADIQAIAQTRLPKATFDYITTGSADQITLRANVAAFKRLRVYPPLMKGVSAADLATTVLGRNIDLPVILAPVAAQRMYHPQGGLAAARAAAAAGTIYGGSSSVRKPDDDIERRAALTG